MLTGNIRTERLLQFPPHATYRVPDFLLLFPLLSLGVLVIIHPPRQFLRSEGLTSPGTVSFGPGVYGKRGEKWAFQ